MSGALMPYVFHSWTSCTDPEGNERTLDWSEEGMRGQFPGLYIEALRQAAIQRQSTYYPGSLFNPLIPAHPWQVGYSFVGERQTGSTTPNMNMILEAIHRCAWDVGSFWTALDNKSGWLRRSAIPDLDGVPVSEQQIPDVMHTQEDLLEAIGQDEAIPLPVLRGGTYRSWEGGLNGAYLRQIREVLMAKTVLQLYDSRPEGGEPVTRDSSEDDPALYGSWPGLVGGMSEWASSTAWGQMPGCYISRSNKSMKSSILRIACRLHWIPGSQYGYPSIVPTCKRVTGYLAAIPWGGHYYNPDYPGMLENVWSKVLDDEPMSSYLGPYFAKTEWDGPAAPAGWDAGEDFQSWGYRFGHQLSICDYQDDFTLGI